MSGDVVVENHRVDADAAELPEPILRSFDQREQMLQAAESRFAAFKALSGTHQADTTAVGPTPGDG